MISGWGGETERDSRRGCRAGLNRGIQFGIFLDIRLADIRIQSPCTRCLLI